MYRVDGRVLYKGIGNDSHGDRVPGTSMFNLSTRGWTPCEAFVMDVAKVAPETFKIIEINCINSSGFYDCDMTQVVKAIENLQPWPDTWRGTPWFDERCEKAVAEWKASLGA